MYFTLGKKTSQKTPQKTPKFPPKKAVASSDCGIPTVLYHRLNNYRWFYLGRCLVVFIRDFVRSIHHVLQDAEGKNS